MPEELNIEAASPSLLVGKNVKYSVTKDILLTGLVLDKIQMYEKPTHQNTVTGYMILDHATGEIKPISYWRISTVLPKTDMPKGDLPGGYQRGS